MLEAISETTTATMGATTSAMHASATAKATKAAKKAAKALGEVEETDEEFRERLPHIRTFARLYALPFVSKRGGGEAHYWTPRATGDWLTDYWMGVAFADAYLSEASLREDDTLLLRIVLNMPRESDGLLVGFLKAVERAAKEGRHAVPEMLFEGDEGCM